MKTDSQITHHLWWLNQFLNKHFNTQEYKNIINKPLDEDTTKELDELVQHIKLNY